MNDKKSSVSIKPDYYMGKSGFDVIDYIEDSVCDVSPVEGFCIGNIIKYVTRYSKKNGVEDLEKAKAYLDRLIEHVSKYSGEK